MIKQNKSAQSPWRGKDPNEKEPKFTSFSFFTPQIKYIIIIQYLSIFSLDSKAKGSEKRQFSSSCHLPWRRGMDTTLSPYKQITDSGWVLSFTAFRTIPVKNPSSVVKSCCASLSSSTNRYLPSWEPSRSN